MKTEFEKAFLKGVRKHAGIKKQIEQKVRQIMEHPERSFGTSLTSLNKYDRWAADR